MRRESTIPARYRSKLGWSLILLDEMGRVFHIAIPRKWVRRALIWGTIVLALAVAVFSRYVYVESQMQMIADKKRMLEEVKLLQEQLRTAYQTEAELRKKVDELSMHLNLEEERRTKRKEKKSGAQKDTAVLRKEAGGVGGGTPESGHSGLVLSEDFPQLDEIFLEQARESVYRWESLWESLKVRLEGLEQEVKRRERLLATVPSGAPVLRPLEITSPFGSRDSPFGPGKEFHAGVDIRADLGDPIIATANGSVVESGWTAGLGRTIRIMHPSGFTTVYGHLSVILVKKGDRVRKGEVIGRAGSTGVSTGPHLHYEVHYQKRALNPTAFLNLTIERVDNLVKKYWR